MINYKLLMSKKTKLEQFLVSRDIYGHAVGVNYRGSGSYQTRMGAFCTLSTYLLMIIYMVNLMIAFNDGSRQEENV